MSPETKKPLSDPILNEFLYTVLYESTYQEKRGLTGRYLKAAMGAKAAKAFVQNSTIEEKMILLNHFGVKYFMVLCKEKSLNLQGLKEMLAKFEQRPASLNDITDAKLFIMGDKELEHLMGIYSQSLHSPSFFLNMEFTRLGYHIKKWPKKNLNERDLQVRDNLGNATLICKTTLKADNIIECSMSLFGIASEQLKILKYFYVNKHTYIEREKAYHEFVGVMKKTKFTYHIKKCWELKLIQRHNKNLLSYTISTAGIKKINNFFDALIKANSF